LIALLLASAGGGWALLQTAAWTGMVIRFSESTTLKDALNKTFDGEHPCCLCKAIAAAKKSEKKAPASLELKKLEFLRAEAGAVLPPGPGNERVPSPAFSAESLTQRPPTPPPRRFFA
jgi:hypothetical protein